MIYFIPQLLLAFALGILIAVLMWNFRVQKRYVISPILISIAPIATLTLAVFMVLAGNKGGELLPEFNEFDILLANIFCTFLLSLLVVWFYRIKSVPYIFVITLVNGIGIPLLFLLLELLVAAGGGWFLYAWPVVFASYTAYYLSAYDLPSDDSDNNTREVEDMSEAERFMAKNVETYEDNE